VKLPSSTQKRTSDHTLQIPQGLIRGTANYPHINIHKQTRKECIVWQRSKINHRTNQNDCV